MKIDCQILEAFRRDFDSLWTCKQLGGTLEITTPYLLPDSTLVSVFLTERDDRFIVCDGGAIHEMLEEYCSLPADEVRSELLRMSSKFTMKEGHTDGRPLYFKECKDAKLIPSLAFDVANFAVMATSALVSASGEPTIPVESRFEKRADLYLRSIAPSDFTFSPRELPEIPNVRFGAVLHKDSRLWLFSFVTGSNPTYFRRSVCDTAISFKLAWESRLASRIKHTIPVVNTESTGYIPDKISSQLDELRILSRQSFVRWDARNDLNEMLIEEMTDET
jgi:hypothetical protein